MANTVVLTHFENNLNNLLTSTVERFIANAVSKHNLNGEDLAALWNSNYALKVTGPKRKDAPASGACSYIFKKGAEKGQLCGGKLDTSSTTYCKRHSKHGTDVDNAAPPASTTNFISSAPAKKNKLVLSKNAHGNYEHAETHLVFTRETGKVAGKQVGDKVEPLTAEDIEVCKKYNFNH